MDKQAVCPTCGVKYGEHYPHLAEALRVWDSGKAERKARWDAARTEAQQCAAVRLESIAEEKVARAFAQDSHNPIGRARLVHPDDPWLRRLVK